MLYHLRSSPCPDLEIKAHYRRACALKQLELWSLGVAACTRGIALGENGGAGMQHQELRTLREELQERAIAVITEQAPKAEAGLPPLPVDMSPLDEAEASE